MTKGEAYGLYQMEANAILRSKEQLRILCKEFDREGERVRLVTRGMATQTRVAEVQKAVAPIREQITQKEAEIIQHQDMADEYFAEWQGLN